MTQTFCRAFADNDAPTDEEIDIALLQELRDCMAIGALTLNCAPCDKVLSVRRNLLRVELERAVMQLPSTEKLIFLMHDVEDYTFGRISRTLGLSQTEIRRGLHQARLRIRELLAE